MGIDPIDHRPVERIPPVKPVTNTGDKAEQKDAPETDEKKKETTEEGGSAATVYVYDARGRVWGIMNNPHPNKGTKH